jgi:hypothetical protein
MTDISSQFGVSNHSSKTNNKMWESRGRYTIHFCKTNNRGVGIGENKVFWHDSKREKMQLKVSDLFIFAIQRYLLVGQGHDRDPNSTTLKILITLPHQPPPVNFEGTIVFPAPELVYTDIYMVGVPYFFEELSWVQAHTSCCQKNPVTLTSP